MAFISNLFKGKTAKSPATGINVQSSIYGSPIPIIYGTTKVAGNLILYGNFTYTTVSTGGGGGKGGLFSGGGTSEYVYYAAFAFALCEGPISGVGTFWQGQNVIALSNVDVNMTVFDGTYTQTSWGTTVSWSVTNSNNETFSGTSTPIPYHGIAYAATPDFQLGTSASMPNLQFEVQGAFCSSVSGQEDADPSLVLTDFLTNQHYGVGYPPARVGNLTQWQQYCIATGLLVSPAYNSQRTASDMIDELMTTTNSACFYSSGLLQVTPYGDQAIAVGSTENGSEADTVIQQTNGLYYITVGNAATFIADTGVTYTTGGNSLTALTSYNTTPPTGSYFCLNGTYYFSSGDVNNGVTITYTYAAQASYVPNLTPIYSLGDNDFMRNPQNNIGASATAGTAGPVLLTRKRKSDTINSIKVEYLDRSNNYNPSIAIANNQAEIDRWGLRTNGSKQLHLLCNATAANLSANLQLRRQLIANTYQFDLDQRYILLDPMDVIEITDSGLGITNQLVRIIQIQENDDQTLSFVCEEILDGTGQAPAYSFSQQQGQPFVNFNTVPDSVNTPIVFEPPPAMLGSTPVGTTPEIWIAASGGSAGAADPNWGGAHVWLSIDGTNYQSVGTVTGPARMGSLTAGLPNYLGTNPDTVDTLSVNLAESGGNLSSTTPTEAGLASNLCIVDDELLTYTTATLISGNTYNLTGLNRGLYGSVIQGHSSGAPFARLDTAIFTYSLPPQYLNQTFYLKLQSFNVYGGGVQALSNCTAYTYSPAALAYAHPLASALEVGSVDMGQVNSTASSADDFGGGVGLLTSTTTQPYILIDIDLSVYFTLASVSLIYRSTKTVSANQYLTLPQNVNANSQKFTFATWFKYGGTSETANLFQAQQGGSSANQVVIQFVNGQSFAISGATTALGTFMSLTTSNLVSDENWHHLCVAVDTTQSTSSNRVELYLDGSLQTLSGTQPSQNTQMPLASGINTAMGTSAGGTITEANGYRIHTFTSSGNFSSSASSSINYLVVAGGGGGGADAGGGGGAGGVLAGTGSVTASGYTVTVGPGGAAGTYVNGSNATLGGNGGNSSVIGSGLSETAVGGGAGGQYTAPGPVYEPGQNGGSGGGGYFENTAAGTGVAGQGNSGGTGVGSSPFPAGGGGGASAAGGNASGSTAGSGGNGTSSSITGSAVTYGGGGGGGAVSGDGGIAGSGGAGGGGNGSASSTVAGTAGSPNTGGGGGGGGPNGVDGGAGGSGIVIISYLYSAGGGQNSFGLGFDGEMSQTYYIDGQQLPASDFASGSPLGPITFLGSYTGVQDGFYAYNNTASSVTLGYDLSGENNNATTVNMTPASNSTSDYP